MIVSECWQCGKTIYEDVDDEETEDIIHRNDMDFCDAECADRYMYGEEDE